MPVQPLNATCTAGMPHQALRPPVQLSLIFSRGLMGSTGGCFSEVAYRICCLLQVKLEQHSGAEALAEAHARLQALEERVAASRLASTSSGGFVAAGEPPAMAAPGAATDCDAFSKALSCRSMFMSCVPGVENRSKRISCPHLALWGGQRKVAAIWDREPRLAQAPAAPDRPLPGWTAAEAAHGCRLLLETGEGWRGATAGPCEAASGPADKSQQHGQPLSCRGPR